MFQRQQERDHTPNREASHPAEKQATHKLYGFATPFSLRRKRRFCLNPSLQAKRGEKNAK